MRTTLTELLESKPVLLADGATGTNYMERGLGPGEPPEFWNIEHTDRVMGLHQDFVDAGADIILTNSFGCTQNRLALHKAEGRVHELARAAAQLARRVADAADRPVVVAGSVGPLGELFEPLGALTHETAVASFREQIEGLKDGGADVAWIETMSSVEEVRAAAQAAIDAGMPYTATLSFDTAGRTMMGILPENVPAIFEGLSVAPVAMGANCGVGASDILVSLLGMSGADADKVFISKGNCGVPQFHGAEIVYSGTTDVMATYAGLAMAAGEFETVQSAQDAMVHFHDRPFTPGPDASKTYDALYDEFLALHDAFSAQGGALGRVMKTLLDVRDTTVRSLHVR